MEVDQSRQELWVLKTSGYDIIDIDITSGTYLTVIGSAAGQKDIALDEVGGKGYLITNLNTVWSNLSTTGGFAGDIFSQPGTIWKIDVDSSTNRLFTLKDNSSFNLVCSSSSKNEGSLII